MGTRNRLRKQAIIDGYARSIHQEKKDVMVEVIKLASRQLFFEQRFDLLKTTQTYEVVACLVVDHLPAALAVTRARYFNLEDITKDDDWREMATRLLQGILARGTDKFRKFDSKGQVFGLRKSKSGRKMNGEWRLCHYCGAPFYVSLSKMRQLFHTRNCYWEDYRARKLHQGDYRSL